MGRRTLILLLLFILTGCVGNGIYVPVYGTGESGRSGTARGYYTVRPGDTLYSIAFRYGLDYKALALANDIRAPYTIFVDQRLRLTERAVATRDGPPAGDRPAPASPPKRSTTTASPPPRPIETPVVADSVISWQWPYEGEVVGKFSLSGAINKGIDIRGKSGEPVRSSAPGVVVYAGGGLRGYGKLVIVKHNERYLSAYGHNQSILVKEGDKVKSGQVVARIGGPNGDSDVLHFEIRRDGKPRNPLEYLPTRS